MEDGRERLSWPARNANQFAGEESCVWPLRPRRSRRRRPSVTPDQSRSAWVWLSDPDRPRPTARPIVELTTSTPLAQSFSAPCSHHVTAADLQFPSTPSPMGESALPTVRQQSHLRLDGVSSQPARASAMLQSPLPSAPHTATAGRHGTCPPLQELTGRASFTAEFHHMAVPLPLQMERIRHRSARRLP